MPSVETASVDLKYRDRKIPFQYVTVTRKPVEDILQGRTYPRVPFLSDVQVVVDAGASVGSAAIWFSLAYPDAQIYSFEPHQESYDLAAVNTSSIPSIHLYNVGLLDSDRDAELFVGAQTFTTNSIHRPPRNVGGSESVTLRDAATMLREIGIERIDVLKVDTEGCELPILRSILASYAPRGVHFEYHSEPDRLQIDGMLQHDFILYAGQVKRRHVGEFTFVRKDALPSESNGTQGPAELSL